MPGGIPACIDEYRNPNWPSDMNVPTPRIVRHGASGRGTRNTAGISTTVKRMAANNSGGTPSIPHPITRKLMPQMVVTIAARRESRRFTPTA